MDTAISIDKAMAERFDGLVEELSEEHALSLVVADTTLVKRPAD